MPVRGTDEPPAGAYGQRTRRDDPGDGGLLGRLLDRIEYDGGPGHGEAIALQTPLTLASNGGIALTCITPESVPPSQTIARYVQLDAIRLDGLVIQ